MGKLIRPTKPPILRWTGNNAALHSGILNDPLFANVVCLLHCDGTNGGAVFTDSSSYARAITASSCVTDTGTVKFGTAAAKFTVSASAATLGPTAGAAAMLIGTGDFCIEFWQYDRQYGYIFTNNNNSHVGAPAGISLLTGLWGGATDFYQILTSDGTGICYWGGITVPTAQFNHVALCRISGVFTLYFNGILQTKTPNVAENGNYANNTFVLNQQFYTGPIPATIVRNLDDFRFTNGNGRYTANFTPPSGPFPNQ